MSEAGGLGVIGVGNAPREVVRKEIEKTRALTRKPFGVNVYLLSPLAEEIIDLVIEEKVPIVVTGAGNPGKYIPRFKDEGIRKMCIRDRSNKLAYFHWIRRYR